MIVLQKTVAHLASGSVTEPNEEPAGIESLEWLFALEHHDGEEEMASLTEAAKLVRLLFDSGSVVSACSLDFAPHVQTHIESLVRARSATGQVTKSLGQEDGELRQKRDCVECEHGGAEDLEANPVGKQDGAHMTQDRV